MQLSDEQVQEFKKIFKEQYGKEIDDKEAWEAAHNLMGFVELSYEVWRKEEQRKLRLKESPNGFAVPNDVGYSCRLCGITNLEQEYWYDENTLKCPICQKALDEGVVPPSVMHDKKSWISMYDVQKKLDLHNATVRKMIRTGDLKARIIKDGEHDHFYVFLKEENALLQDFD